MVDRSFEVPVLARVEGEGALHLTIEGGVVTDARLRIYEPPRFFEGWLRGRRFDEPVDLTARICGICPVAYQMSAVQALEDACGVTVDPIVDDLRRLLYCGEWIESHLLHMVLLHIPDFLGLPSGLALAADHRDRLEAGLRTKQTGNRIVDVVGGRAIHPVNVRVGGFHRAPRRDDLTALLPAIELALVDVADLVRWAATFTYPELEHDLGYVSLHHPDEYPMHRGVLARSWGPDAPVAAWPELFVEHQVAHSTALHAATDTGAPYVVGPLARYARCADQLSPASRSLAAEAGIGSGTRNPFRSLLVRGVEAYEALLEARRIIEGYRPPDRSWEPVEARPGVGHGASEAPRGTLYHRYEIAEDGTIASAVIVPPTAQNQTAMEADLRAYATAHLDRDDDALRHGCELVIRNFDPCISCSTHFLRLEVDRS